MTRFARAQGSKSSNKREPEIPTSWQVMKQQLQEAQNTSNKNKGDSNLSLNAHNKLIKSLMQDEDKMTDEAEWASFQDFSTSKSETNVIKTKNPKKSSKLTTSNEKNESSKKNADGINSYGDFSECNQELQTFQEKGHKRKHKCKLNNAENDGNLSECFKTTENSEERKHKKNKKRKHNDNLESNLIMHEDANMQLQSKTNDNKSNPNENIKHREKKVKNINESGRENVVGKRPKKHSKQKINNSSVPSKTKDNHDKEIKSGIKHKHERAYKRRKPDEGSIKLMINGGEIEIVKFDGFPVKKDDANRLQELRQKMISKGIPKYEMEMAIKIERRKAEKTLAREKKSVCFLCRKSGHILSECQELGDGHNAVGTGVCFKCGSTEHAYFQCKVIRGQEFRYATCFVCNEPGHIASQCPDNPRGLYPKGGACRLCGDVTHLKKDCPDLMKEKEEHNITLETLDNDLIEVLDEYIKIKSKPQSHIKKNKIIKF